MTSQHNKEASKSDSSEHSSAPARGVRVLLAEDDRALRRYLEVILMRAGYQVTSAADGLEAMKALLNSSVDIVITDAIMPNLSGYELCRFVRASQQLSKVPIVLLSALGRKDALSEAEQADAFLSKPVSPEDLLECVEGLVST
ncbi:MAG: PleD family two-component system response regulator [Pyrinomonadaceae bacterium]